MVLSIARDFLFNTLLSLHSIASDCFVSHCVAVPDLPELKSSASTAESSPDVLSSVYILVVK